MEQQKQAATKPKNKFLNLLPRAASSVAFRTPPLYSPGKEKKSSEKSHKSNLGIGFSGPLVTMAPSDNRRKSKKESSYTLAYEPTSPVVSCMGQVKCKQYQKRLVKQASKITRSMSFNPKRMHNKGNDQEKVAKVDLVADAKSKKKLGRIMSIFGGGSRSKRYDATNDKPKNGPNIPKAPGLSTMTRFSSGRDAFANFDWTTQVAPSDSGRKNYFTDGESDHEGDGEIKVPSSVPVMVRNKGVSDKFVRVKPVKLEPTKEINLWKRRTMAQPKPLQLHVD